jgi:hypothetical protein
LFGVTLIPYNAFHLHEHDAHVAAMFSEQEELQHHCELDEYTCQVSLLHACEHKNHIAQTHPDCFSCTFHFIKNYQHTAFLFQTNLVQQAHVFIDTISNSGSIHLPAESNRGPPTSCIFTA